MTFTDAELMLIYESIYDEHERRLRESGDKNYLADTHELLAKVLRMQAEKES
tara:strand:+ start:366 stop:521 length:156 start_codon:yes stop_codon:yes gene_type:complete